MFFLPPAWHSLFCNVYVPFPFLARNLIHTVATQNTLKLTGLLGMTPPRFNLDTDKKQLQSFQNVQVTGLLFPNILLHLGIKFRHQNGWKTLQVPGTVYFEKLQANCKECCNQNKVVHFPIASFCTRVCRGKKEQEAQWQDPAAWQVTGMWQTIQKNSCKPQDSCVPIDNWFKQLSPSHSSSNAPQQLWKCGSVWKTFQVSDPQPWNLLLTGSAPLQLAKPKIWQLLKYGTKQIVFLSLSW